MPDVPFSSAVIIGHMAATHETVALGHRMISPDLFICGITKLEDVMSMEALHEIGLSPQMAPLFLAEAQQIMQVFLAAGIDPRQTRRSLRQYVGSGGYQHEEGEHISRSDMVRGAFDHATDIAADNGAQVVMAHHLLAALLEIPHTATRQLLSGMGIDVDALVKQFASLPAPEPVYPMQNNLLNRLGTDLVASARANELAPVIGRKNEMLQVVKILGRDKKNCPVLVGVAGVGKSAIVEGLAQRIAARNIHPDFHNKRIVQIDASSLVSGTKYRGEFEERLEQLIAEAVADVSLILFIDEIHLLVGAGAIEGGGMDAANILKPTLASGKIKLIGATTDAEYRRHIAKDPALERRFEPVHVEEPAPHEAAEMLAGARARLQGKHSVAILDEAIDAAVSLSMRYIIDRFLPDKAYTLLDDACVWVRYGAKLSFNLEQFGGDTPINTVTRQAVSEVLADRLGVPVSNLEDDERRRIMRMDVILRERIVGQDAAIRTIAQAVQRHCL